VATAKLMKHLPSKALWRFAWRKAAAKAARVGAAGKRSAK